MITFFLLHAVLRQIAVNVQDRPDNLFLSHLCGLGPNNVFILLFPLAQASRSECQ